MCGRYQLRVSREGFFRKFGLKIDHPFDEFNITPGKPGSILIHQHGRRHLTQALWQERKSAPDTWLWSTNAKGENLSRLRIWRTAANHQRCLIPATGWYEWGGRPHPTLLTYGRGKPFALGGLTQDFANQLHHAIVTTQPNEVARTIHHRMPLIIQPADYDRWLDPHIPLESLQPLLQPAPASQTEVTAVLTLARQEPAYRALLSKKTDPNQTLLGFESRPGS